MNNKIKVKLIESMESDDDYKESKLIKYFDSLKDSERVAIDNFLINLCGYSFNTLRGEGNNESQG